MKKWEKERVRKKWKGNKKRQKILKEEEKKMVTVNKKPVV